MFPQQYEQFMLWKLADDGKNKLPVSPHSFEVVTAHDSQHWTSRDVAEMALTMVGDGFGLAFVFTKDDPFFFLDIDKCREGDQWSPLALRLCDMLPGSLVEVSQSGTGLHIFGSYQGELHHKKKNTDLGIELYTELRFCALTGNVGGGDVTIDQTANIQAVIDEYFAPEGEVNRIGWRDTPVDGYHGPSDDDALIKRMAASRGSAATVFGNKCTVMDLFTGNSDKISASFPSQNDHDPYDRSSADMSLASHLAFWTGKNHSRIERLMRRSELNRTKWDNHRTYLADTIRNAVNGCQDVFGGSGAVPVQPMQLTTGIKQGAQILSVDGQLTHFKDCVYIQDQHQVFVGNGEFLSPAQFKSTYGGYAFVFDDDGKTKTNAYEVFTESQLIAFPKVTSSCFRPEHPPMALVKEEDRELLNTYIPIQIDSEYGDVSPFIQHLERLLPDDRDREIMISYMAACVQYKGVKFQWCPLLQGCEGNGKTLIITALSHALGHRYTHLPNANDLGGNGAKFNSWIQNKLLIGIEEIYVADRREVTDALKPLITNKRIEIQGKGVNQFTGDNRANFIMCSNHKDALPVSIDSRRYAIFYTAQQSKEEMARDGMDNQYFRDLYDWGENGGFKYITYWLENYMIKEEFNPATLCNVAPMTSSTEEAISATRGSVEQEVLEMINQNAVGFSGGWVSSAALEQLLVRMKMDRAINMYKRIKLMESLGYHPHRHLPAGRPPEVIPVIGSRPVLFIKEGLLQNNLTDPAKIVEEFCRQQRYPTGFGENVNKLTK